MNFREDENAGVVGFIIGCLITLGILYLYFYMLMYKIVWFGLLTAEGWGNIIGHVILLLFLLYIAVFVVILAIIPTLFGAMIDLD